MIAAIYTVEHDGGGIEHTFPQIKVRTPLELLTEIAHE